MVNFIGACHTPPNVCLVTEYCARGSLDHLLHKSGLHLDLIKKVEFALDIARGMSCLHAQNPPIIHRLAASAVVGTDEMKKGQSVWYNSYVTCPRAYYLDSVLLSI